MKKIIVFLLCSITASVSATEIEIKPAPSQSEFLIQWELAESETIELQERSLRFWRDSYQGDATGIALDFPGEFSKNISYRARTCEINESGVKECGAYGNSKGVHVAAAPIQASWAVNDFNDSNGSFTISWQDARSEDFDYNVGHYRLFRKKDNGNWIEMDVGTSSTTNSFVASNYSDGVYRFNVQACNFAGCGDLSEDLTVTVFKISNLADSTLKISPKFSTGSFKLAWGHPGNAAFFHEIEEATLTGFNRIVTSQNAGTKTMNKPEGLYKYRIRRCHEDPGAGGAGKICFAWSPLKQIRVKSIPGITEFTENEIISSNGNFNLQWQPANKASFYYLYENLNDSSWQRVAGKISDIQINRNIDVRGTYKYKIQACNNGGCGELSSQTTVRVNTNPIKPSGIIVPELSADGNVNISWENTDHYSHTYRILRNGNVIGQTSSLTYNFISPDGEQTLTVSSCNEIGLCSEPSDPVTVLVRRLPNKNHLLLNVPTTTYGSEFDVHWSYSNSGLATVDHFELQRFVTDRLFDPVPENNWEDVQLNHDLDTSVNQSVATDGAIVYYRLRACNSSGCSEYTTQLKTTVNLTLASLIPNHEVVQLSVPEVEHVGTIDGKSGVSGGKLSYSLQLVTPPGRNEIQPTVSLEYSSANSAGSAGVGWSVSTGSHAISRCSRIIDVDGVNVSQYGLTTDPLCYKGHYLKLIEGTYGENGSSYRTEVDDFNVIRLEGGSINEIASHFIVQDRAGIKYRYDQVLIQPGFAAPIQWRIGRYQDLHGNNVIYEYNNLSTEPLLVAIHYTGSYNEIGNRSIQFIYEADLEKKPLYHISGGQYFAAQRLQSIVSFVGNELASKYELSYDVSPATNRSLLRSVTRCGDVNCHTSYPPTTFAYSDQPFVVFDPIKTTADGPVNRGGVGPDFDGDGTPDKYSYTYSQSNVTGAFTLDQGLIHLSGGGVIDITEDWFAGSDVEFSEAALERANDFDQDGLADFFGTQNGQLVLGHYDSLNNELVIKNTNISTNGLAGSIGDLNRDGKTDIIVTPLTGVRTVYYNCSTQGDAVINFCDTFALYQNVDFNHETASVADLNGDGISDLVITSKYSPNPTRVQMGQIEQVVVNGLVKNNYSLMASVPFESISGLVTLSNEVLQLDANGDGLIDIYHETAGGGMLYLNKGGDAVLWAAGELMYQPMSINNWQYLGVSSGFQYDYDQDGKHDLMYATEMVNEYCVFLDTGSPEPEYLCGNNAPQNHSGYKYNRAEFVFNQDGSVSFELQTTELELPKNSAPRSCDYNGDGMTDICFGFVHFYNAETNNVSRFSGDSYYDSGGHYGLIKQRSANKFGVDLLNEVTSGLGAKEEWGYAPLSGASASSCEPSSIPLYQVDRNANTFGHFHFNTSMTVLTESQVDNGIGGKNSTCYHYKDAMFSTGGRGFQGFRSILVRENLNDQNNLITESVFSDQFPMTGMETKQSIYVASQYANGQPVKVTEYYYESESRDFDTQVILDYGKRERVYDINSGMLVSQRSVSNEYLTDLDRMYANPSRTTSVSETFNHESNNHELLVRNVTETNTTWDYSLVSGHWLDKLNSVSTHIHPSEYRGELAEIDLSQTDQKIQTTVQSYHWSGLSRRNLDRIEYQAGISEEELITQFLYDEYGNTTKTIQTTHQENPRQSEVIYDAEGYFPVMQLDGMQNPMTMQFNRKFGLLEQSTTPNNLATTHTINQFGVVTRTLTTGTQPAYSRLLLCGGAQTSFCPQHAAVKQMKIQNGSPVQSVYLDLLGRPVLHHTTATEVSPNAYMVTQYNARGHMVSQSEPSPSLNGSDYTVYSQFDALGRYARKTKSRTGHPFSSQQWQYVHHGMTTTVTLPDPTLVVSHIKDTNGNIVRTTDPAGHTAHNRYNGAGQMILMQNPLGVQTRYWYDNSNRLIMINDADSGTTEHTYNGFGEIKTSRDANGRMLSNHYDVLGRLLSRDIDGELQEWFYDESSPLTLSRMLSTQGESSFLEAYAHDEFGRVKSKVRVIDTGLDMHSEYLYDRRYGRISAVKHPSGEIVGLQFDPQGMLLHEFKPTEEGGFNYTSVNAMNARGQLTEKSYGNGVIENMSYFNSTGDLRQHKVRYQQNTLMHHDYTYGDQLGNLTTREFQNAGVSESFDYDSLNRVILSTKNWQDGTPEELIEYDYDAAGNIILKSDFAQMYLYGDEQRDIANAGPHGIKELVMINGDRITDFNYDNSGNMLTGHGKTITYNYMNQPTRIIEANGEVSKFFYAPDSSLYKKIEGQKVTYYGPDGFQQVEENGNKTKRTNIASGVLIISTNNQREVHYRHHDRLGSLALVTDESGLPIESFGYDVFGKPLSADLKPTTTVGLPEEGLLASSSGDRGYTGHEHLDTHRMIHMQGRLYDPLMARFVSVDPIIQSPSNTQSQNPYAYVMNNPLMGTDPSGYACVTFTGESGEGTLECDDDPNNHYAEAYFNQEVGNGRTFADGTVLEANRSELGVLILTVREVTAFEIRAGKLYHQKDRMKALVQSYADRGISKKGLLYQAQHRTDEFLETAKDYLKIDDPLNLPSFLTGAADDTSSSRIWPYSHNELDLFFDTQFSLTDRLYIEENKQQAFRDPKYSTQFIRQNLLKSPGQKYREASNAMTRSGVWSAVAYSSYISSGASHDFALKASKFAQATAGFASVAAPGFHGQLSQRLIAPNYSTQQAAIRMYQAHNLVSQSPASSPGYSVRPR
ncbi:RHS repeat-associated core domain-containing protein [Marinicella sp. W31]|uniref:RHS repeat-associated core domain-containing protein n=1 Tax=Marinicella sp. W31 TaxID=3023713 RepID=UPI003756715D